MEEKGRIADASDGWRRGEKDTGRCLADRCQGRTSPKVEGRRVVWSAQRVLVSVYEARGWRHLLVLDWTPRRCSHGDAGAAAVDEDIASISSAASSSSLVLYEV